MELLTLLVLLIHPCLSGGAESPLAGLPFASSLAAGQAVVLPKCHAHMCTAKDDLKGQQQCSCQDDCYKQRDCCLDALSDHRVAQLFETDPWICVRSLRGHGPYSAFGRCPKEWKDEGVRKACEGPVDVNQDPNRALLVRSTRTNTTYRNIYCGQCNEGELQPGQFQLRFRCTGGENVTNVPAALAEKNCDVHLETSYCTLPEKTVADCPATWQHKNATFAKEVRWRCGSYFAPLTLSEKRYKNAFCALCNNVTWKLDDVVCHNNFYPVEKEFILKVDGEFNSGTLIPGAGGGKVCSPGEVYDPFRKECRRVICANETDCNSNRTQWGDETVQFAQLPSPCNMTLFAAGKFKTNDTTDQVTVTGDDGKEEVYSAGEYDRVSAGPNNGSILVCQRINAKTIAMFPQHFCERRRLLGYGSCGCELECVQSRSCCLDALDEPATRHMMARGEDVWVCLNDSRRSSALAKCPGNFTDRQVRNQCENPPPLLLDPLLHVPVFAWDSTTLYRNVYCAVCNGASNVTFYDVRFLCAEHTKVHNGLEAAELFREKPDLCSLTTEAGLSDLPVRPCVEDHACLRCPSTWGSDGDPRQLSMLWRCDHHYAPVEINGTCYRNDFCAYCNGLNPMDPSLHRIYSNHMMNIKSSPPKKDTFSTFTVG